MLNEIGAILKDPGGKLNIALIYPNTYRVGMSNLGFQTMYRVFNEHQGIVCERFFADCERSVEAHRPLSDFPVLAFSLSYELDAIEMIRILMKNRITPRVAHRGGRPVLIAGGSAVTLNPEPIADAVDILHLGDGEPLPGILHDAYTHSSSYSEFIDALVGTDGIYIPSRTYPRAADDFSTGFSGPTPMISLVDPLDIPAHSTVLSKQATFGDMFMVETARGCPYRCGFCTAREIYAPFRPVSLARLTEIFDKAQPFRLKVGLVSTSLNNHPEASRIFQEITGRGMKIAPPSLRLGILSEELLDALRTSAVLGVTLAPETGSEDLRYATGKRISNQTVLEDIRMLIEAGIRDVKLYFMVGIPGEQSHHIDATIDLIKRIRQTFIRVSRGNKKLGTVSVSINTMVPKPHTRFEREPMISPDEARSRIRKIVRAMKGQSNVSVSFEGPKWAYLQALFSRGDRSVLDLIELLARNEKTPWQEILRQWPKNSDFYALRERTSSEVLPWSFYRLACEGT
ncbi:MAG: B12-binding domain-containing radical SAM protein [Desulfomonilia bacterium]